MTLVEHAVARGQVMGQIQDCRACTLVNKARQPVPFRGPSPNKLMLLGEAPGADEDLFAKPFIGPAGKLMDRYLIEADLPRLQEWFIANVCCCRSIGPPEPDKQEACRPNLRAQLTLCNPEWVLALGATALGAVLPKVKITKVHGRPFYVPAGPFIGRWCFPTFHPAAALRDNTNGYANGLHADLSTLSQILAGKIERSVLAARVGRGGKVYV